MPSVDAQFVLGLVGHQVPIQAFFGFLHNTMNIQVIRDEIRLRGTLGTHVPAYLDLYQAEIQRLWNFQPPEPVAEVHRHRPAGRTGRPQLAGGPPAQCRPGTRTQCGKNVSAAAEGLAGLASRSGGSRSGTWRIREAVLVAGGSHLDCASRRRHGTSRPFGAGTGNRQTPPRRAMEWDWAAVIPFTHRSPCATGKPEARFLPSSRWPDPTRVRPLRKVGYETRRVTNRRVPADAR